VKLGKRKKKKKKTYTPPKKRKNKQTNKKQKKKLLSTSVSSKPEFFHYEFKYIFSVKHLYFQTTEAIQYSQTSVPRIGRTLWMARTDLKVPSIFLIFLSKENPFRSKTDTSNSRTQ
jgi:hypothetical protein